MPLLLAAPVPFRTVFTVTLIEGALAAPLVLGLALLALVAYGIGVGAGIAYYVVVVIGLVATAAFVTALTQMLVTLTLRVIPAQRAKEGLTLLGAVITVAAYGVYYSTRFARGQIGDDGTATFAAFVDRITPVARIVPPGWAGFGATAAQRGDVVRSRRMAWCVACRNGADHRRRRECVPPRVSRRVERDAYRALPARHGHDAGKRP